MQESFSAFRKRIEQHFSHVLSIIKKTNLNKVDEFFEKEKNPFDADIQIFIQKLLTCYNNVIYDPALAADQMHFDTHIIHQYLKSVGEEFTPKFKSEICGLHVKQFGQMTGGLLAAYLVRHPNEKNSLADLISEYSSGV
jgi:heme oxygenase